MISTCLILDWSQIARDSWDLLLKSTLKLFDAIKLPVWDYFLKDWVFSNAIWLIIITLGFIIGFPITSRERRKLRKRYFSIWALISTLFLVLKEIYHIL